MEPQNNNYQTFFAAAGVAFDPLLPAGMTPSPLIVAPPPSRPAGVTRAHVEHPHHFGHAAPHGHSHAGHAPPSPPRVPLHSHHPGVVSHGHQVLTAHLKDKSRAEWREAERHDREQLVRERRGVRGIAEPRGSLGRQGAASHSGTPEQSFAPSSMRRASIAFPEPPVARPRERRLSLPAGFTFPEQLHSPVLSDERDAATLLGVDVPNTHPLHHDSLGRTKDTTKRAAELFRDSRHRAQDLARGLQGKDMEVDSDAGVMSVEFPAHGIQQIDTLIYHRIVLPRLLELDASLVPLLHAGKLALPDGTVVAPQPVQPKGDENRLPRLEELLEAGELEGLRRSAAEFLGVS